jgi:hypothetical protein
MTVLKHGMRVRTITGAVETVLAVYPARVITFESAERNTWYHPTKVAVIERES